MRKQGRRGLAAVLAVAMGLWLLSVPAGAAGERGGFRAGGVPAVSYRDGNKDKNDREEEEDGRREEEDGGHEEKEEDRDEKKKEEDKKEDKDSSRDDDDDDNDDDDNRRDKDRYGDDGDDDDDDDGDGHEDGGRLYPDSDLIPPSTAKPNPHIQHIVKPEKEIVDWGDRIEPPDYAKTLYDVLSEGVKSGEEPGSLVQDGSFTLPEAPSAGAGQEIVQIEIVNFDLADVFAGEGVSLGVSVFEYEDFYRIDPALSDRQVNYAALKLGDVVRTAAFNGIFVTSAVKGADYDQVKELTCSYISTVYQAFDRDHPEVFWLSGACQVRIPVVRAADGTERAYFFLVLVDSAGFTMRAPDWTERGAVADGIRRREAAVEQILDAVTADSPAETVRQLNRWLTEHNEYNTTPDLTTIGNEPHECLSALEGREGEDGPVCDGYSRAFKVLCDRLDIPCVLENGYAKTGLVSLGTYHMWNAVKIGDSWYGVDVTWNDPIIEGVSGAKSGWENEQYLLIGSKTIVRGMTFAASHPATNQASHDGVAFDNGPLLCSVAYMLPFADVAEDSWCYDAVSYMYRHNLMTGASSVQFSPDQPVTRKQFWMILARADGGQPADMEAARDWAVAAGVSDGSGPDELLTREQMVSMLWRYAGSPASSGQLEAFTDKSEVSGYAAGPVSWAAANGIITGLDGGRIDPKGSATRAQTAAIFQRFLEAGGE